MSKNKKLKKNDPSLKTGFTNCKPGVFSHQMVLVKGFGVRCAVCGKISSDCTGARVKMPHVIDPKALRENEPTDPVPEDMDETPGESTPTEES